LAEIEDETLNRLIELSATKTQILREQNQIQDALENHSKEELIELVSHLTKAYVIDSPALSGSSAPAVRAPVSTPIRTETVAPQAPPNNAPETPDSPTESNADAAPQSPPAAPTRRKRSRMVEFD